MNRMLGSWLIATEAVPHETKIATKYHDVLSWIAPKIMYHDTRKRNIFYQLGTPIYVIA
jgi:hypothetical protein